MNDLSILGNAAAVPIIIGFTQFLKRNFSFKYKSDVVALVVSVLVCFGWYFYVTPLEDLIAFSQQHWIVVTKGVIQQLIVAFATWLSASKSYDLFYGTKKREKKHALEKNQLRLEVRRLENGNGKAQEAPPAEDPTIDNKLREILEG